MKNIRFKLLMTEQEVKRLRKDKAELQQAVAKLEAQDAANKKALEQAVNQEVTNFKKEMLQKLEPVLINTVNSVNFRDKPLSDKVRAILEE